MRKGKGKAGTEGDTSETLDDVCEGEDGEMPDASCDGEMEEALATVI